jgi:hypothetical protein
LYSPLDIRTLFCHAPLFYSLSFICANPLIENKFLLYHGSIRRSAA